MGAGLTLIRAWANAGTRIKPSDGKIDQGWLAGEQPPVEYENERMYSRDTLVNQIISYLNAGVPLSDVVTTSASSLTITGTAYRTLRDVYGYTAEKFAFGSEQKFEMNRFGFGCTLSAAGSAITSIRFISVDLTGITWTQVDNIDSGSLYLFRKNEAIPTLSSVAANASTQIMSAVLIDNSTGYSLNCEVNITYSGVNELIISDIYVLTALYTSLSIKSLNLILGDVTASI